MTTDKQASTFGDMTAPSTLVSVSDAALMLSLSRSGIYKLMNSGLIPALKSGRRTLIKVQAIYDYADTLGRYQPPAVRTPKAPQAALSGAPGIDKILRLKEVKALAGLGTTSIYERSANGTFPPKVKLGGRTTGWRASEVATWIADPQGYRATDSYDQSQPDNTCPNRDL